MKLDSLSPRQRQIVEYLRERSRVGAYPPSVRDIGRAVGLTSSSTVQTHLNTLERLGLIHRDPTKSRTVTLAEALDTRQRLAGARPLPLVGQVAAGAPLLAEQNIEDQIVLGPEISGGDDSFLLRVRGDSMTGDGIFDGDLVVVRPGSQPEEGSLVVARLENVATGEPEVTVKRLFREPGRVRLQPSNPAYEPIFAENVRIEGRVGAVIRLLR